MFWGRCGEYRSPAAWSRLPPSAVHQMPTGQQQDQLGLAGQHRSGDFSSGPPSPWRLPSLHSAHTKPPEGPWLVGTSGGHPVAPATGAAWPRAPGLSKMKW